MFTISLPIILPDDRSFHADGHPLPQLEGKYVLSCEQTVAGFANAEDSYPLILKIDGFETRAEAEQFLPKMIASLRWASMTVGHSISPSIEPPIEPQTKHFDGSKPAIFETALGCRGWFAKASSVGSQHVTVLGNAVKDAFAHQVPTKFLDDPKLQLAFELYSDVEFAGSTNAKFIVLISALEIFVKANAGRGVVIKFVKDALITDGQSDAKATGKVLDNLFILRNSLLHEAKSVNGNDLKVLREIVARVLRALVNSKV
jgi:hypothetical protein